MTSRRLTVRAIALLGAGSAGVHQLRYAIGYGDAAPHALAAHGHGYLTIALPGVLTAVLIALTGVLMRLAAGRRDGDAAPRGSGMTTRAGLGLSLPALWIAAALALATIYGVQETVEGSGAFAGSGWIGFALAIPAGLLVALALRGADAAEELRIAAAELRAFAIAAAPPSLRPIVSPRPVGLRRVAARGPPATSVV